MNDIDKKENQSVATPADDGGVAVVGMPLAKKEKKHRKSYFHLFGTDYDKEESLWGWVFILPAFILAIIFIFLPIGISLFYAFTDANLLRMNDVHFVGFENFVRAFQDETLLMALKNTALFVVEVVPLQLCTSLGLALILNKVSHGSTFLRWAFFCPVMLSLAVTSMLWMNLLNTQDGLINALILALGGDPVLFLDSPDIALHTIVFISAWQGAGYQMLIFLSALKNVSPSLYEAAKMDGANAWNRFIHITLPAIKPTFSFVLITMLIGAFRICVQPMIMTGGGPLDSTMTMSYYIYLQGTQYREVGYSSAIALLFTFIMAAVSLTLRRLLEGKKK